VAKNQDQFAFNFQPQPSDPGSTGRTANSDPDPQNDQASKVAVYYLEHRRLAKLKRESAAHFSAILGLVTHLK